MDCSLQTEDGPLGQVNSSQQGLIWFKSKKAVFEENRVGITGLSDKVNETPRGHVHMFKYRNKIGGEQADRDRI